jgi:putative ubiquitin-RnfH superfamily antitoxin RatB of RatAB toxin-antitoxin module
MRIEVAFALPDRQWLESVTVPGDAVVADALRLCGVAERFPEVRFDELQAGIWGKPVERTHALREGDRVELYRPLEMDPREARRLKAGL